MSTIPAVVAYAPEDGQIKWKYEQISAPREPKEGEVQVRMVATGICHTDIFVSSLPEGAMGLTYPKIMGHEGAGYIEAVGPGVTVAAKGDPVLLSYNYCSSCDLCKDNQPVYCQNFHKLNFLGEQGIHPPSPDNQADPKGKFFGQSSFASIAVVDEKCVVNVKDKLQTLEELKRCAPLGCGLMTGAGASIKHLKPHDIVLVLGLGAVGIGAIMAAKQMGAKAIIAVDRSDARLKLAKEVGATHLYDNTGKEMGDFVKDVQSLVNGERISYGMDTTGFVPLIEQAITALGHRGRMLQIGVPGVETSVTLQMGDFFFQNKAYEIHYLGEEKAEVTVSKMLQWYNEGKFPIDKIIQFYHVDKVQEALEDMKSKTIKPILVW